MKTKMLLVKTIIATIILLLWASPALGVALNALPEFHYKIQPFQMIADESEPEHEKQGFWASRDPWTKKDTYWQIGFTILEIIDYEKTRIDINNDGYEWGFAKYFIGETPSNSDLKEYFATCIILHSIASYVLPSKWRTRWQKVSVLVQIYYIGESKGTRILFGW